MLKFTEMRLPAANLGIPNVLPDVKADTPTRFLR